MAAEQPEMVRRDLLDLILRGCEYISDLILRACEYISDLILRG
jgi:hypothetical protein